MNPTESTYSQFDSQTPPKRQVEQGRTQYSRFDNNYANQHMIVKGSIPGSTSLERPPMTHVSSSIRIPSVPEDSPQKTVKGQQWIDKRTVDLNSQFQASSQQIRKPQTMVEKLIKMSEATKPKKMIKSQIDFIPKTSKVTNKQPLGDMSRISERPEGWINDSELTISSFNVSKPIQEPRVQVSRETSTESQPKQEKVVIFSCYQDGQPKLEEKV